MLSRMIFINFVSIYEGVPPPKKILVIDDLPKIFPHILISLIKDEV